MRAMNSRWYLVQGSTSKRVNMEREKEKDLLEELNKLRRQVQDQKARRDNLLRLIKKLQKQQALGPPAVGARSPSVERANVAHAVASYLQATDTSRGSVDIPSDLRARSSPSPQHQLLVRLKGFTHLVKIDGEWNACNCETPGRHVVKDYQVISLCVDRCEFCGSSGHKSRNHEGPSTF